MAKKNPTSGGQWRQVRAVVGPDGQPRPIPRVNERSLKIRTWTVIGLLLAAAITGPLATVAVLSQKPTVVDVMASVPKGRGIAEIVAKEYVQGQAISVNQLSSVAVAAGSKAVATPSSTTATTQTNSPTQNTLDPLFLTWDGFEKSTYDIGGLNGATYPLEIHKFVIQMAPGTDGTVEQFTLSVPIVFVGASPSLLALPSLEPLAGPNTVDKPSGDYSESGGFVKAKPSSNFQASIQSWASAWVSDKPEDLTAAMASDPKKFTYKVLGSGFILDTTRGVQSTPGLSISQSPVVAGNNSDAIVRVRVFIKRANESSTQGVFQSQMDLDLLVSDPNSTAPHVTAWGPAGSGSNLVAYISNNTK